MFVLSWMCCVLQLGALGNLEIWLGSLFLSCWLLVICVLLAIKLSTTGHGFKSSHYSRTIVDSQLHPSIASRIRHAHQNIIILRLVSKWCDATMISILRARLVALDVHIVYKICGTLGNNGDWTKELQRVESEGEGSPWKKFTSLCK